MKTALPLGAWLLAVCITSTPLLARDTADGHDGVAVENEEALAALTAAVRTLLDGRKDFTLDAPQVVPDGAGYVVTGSATFFGIGGVNIEGHMADATTVTSFKATFPAGSDLDRRDQKNLTREVMDKWVPGSLKDVLKMESFTLGFTNNSVSHADVAMSCSVWSLLGPAPVNARDFKVSYAVENPLDKHARSMQGVFSGTVEMGGTSIAMTCTATSDREEWTLNGDLAHISVDALLGACGVNKPDQVPSALWGFGLETCTVSFAPFSETLALHATSDLGTAEFALSSGRGNQHEFLLGFSPPANFSFSGLDPGLSVLDQLHMQRTALVLSSTEQASRLALFNDLGQTPTVGRGLTLLSAYDINALSSELGKLMGTSTVLLRATLSDRVADLELQAGLQTNINLDSGGNVVLTGVNFSIKPAPSNFTVGLGGDMLVKMDKDQLRFKTKIGVDITNLSLNAEGMLQGAWNNPFGISRGVQIADLGLGFGVSFKTTPIPLPALSFAGKLKVGDPGNPKFSGDVAVAVDPSSPQKCMVDAGFDKIVLGDIVSACAPTATVPENLRNTVLTATLEHVRVTVVPNPAGVTLFEKTYDPGFLVAGDASIAGFKALFKVGVAADGIEARAGIGSIRYEPFFALTGAGKDPDPYIHLIVKDPASSGLTITGKAMLLGISSETKMTLSDTDFKLHMEGKIFDAFQASLDVSGGNVHDGGTYGVVAEMRNDLLQYVTEHASQAIDAATKQTQNDITNAQNTVSQEQNKLNGLYADVESMRNTVRQERERDCRRLRDAESSVTSAQNEVNSLQNQINDLNNTIHGMESEISSNPLRGVDLGPQIVYYGTQVAGLESAKAVAWGVLEGARATVGGMGYLCEQTPIDADPRVAAMIGSIETSKGVMEGAKQVMEGAKIAGVGTLSAADWIVKNGNPMGVVNITYAKFEGTLSAANGGEVALQVKGTFADRPINEQFSFSFSSPQATVEAWTRKLLGI